MLNELLNLSIKDRNKIISGLSSETKKHIFNSIYTMTEELALDKVKDFSKRVQMRAKLIEQFPDTVFWDYALYPKGDNIFTFNNTLISTNGDMVKLNPQNRLIIRSSKDVLDDYVSFIVKNNKQFAMHRSMGTIFIPIPERLKNIPISKLQVNHKDKVKNNNNVKNLEWVTIQENVKHGLGFKDYLEEEYFLFEVLADNGFKGKKFVLTFKEARIITKYPGDLRKFSVVGYTINGFKVTKIKPKTVKRYDRGMPSDIKELYLKNKTYFNIRIKPIIAEVVEGEFKGFRFSLLGFTELNKYFDFRTVLKIIKNGKGITYGCGFKRCSIKEAIPLHRKLTPEIIESLNKHKRKSKKDKENK